MNPASCFRRVLSLCVEAGEDRLEDRRHLDMELRKKQK
jgi:hypothetical protein